MKQGAEHGMILVQRFWGNGGSKSTCHCSYLFFYVSSFALSIFDILSLYYFILVLSIFHHFCKNFHHLATFVACFLNHCSSFSHQLLSFCLCLYIYTVLIISHFFHLCSSCCVFKSTFFTFIMFLLNFIVLPLFHFYCIIFHFVSSILIILSLFQYGFHHMLSFLSMFIMLSLFHVFSYFINFSSSFIMLPLCMLPLCLYMVFIINVLKPLVLRFRAVSKQILTIYYSFELYLG